jgi:hypothetical protein
MDGNLADLLKLAAFYIVHPEKGSSDERNNLAKELLFRSLMAEDVQKQQPLPLLEKPASGVKTRGMTADIPQPRKKDCCGGEDGYHLANCPMRAVTAKKKRDARFGTRPFAICHWDTFDNEVILKAEADTFDEAKKKIEELYGERLSAEGADRVEIVDEAGSILKIYGVK